jgi:hypothetical protein
MSYVDAFIQSLLPGTAACPVEMLCRQPASLHNRLHFPRGDVHGRLMTPHPGLALISFKRRFAIPSPAAPP